MIPREYKVTVPPGYDQEEFDKEFATLKTQILLNREMRLASWRMVFNEAWDTAVRSGGAYLEGFRVCLSLYDDYPFGDATEHNKFRELYIRFGLKELADYLDELLEGKK